MVVEPDVHSLGIEDLLDLVDDELIHRLHVEFRGKAFLNAVDDLQLGGALVCLGQEALGLVEEPGILKSHAHARSDCRYELHVRVAECVEGMLGEGKHTDDSFATGDRHSEVGLLHAGVDIAGHDSSEIRCLGHGPGPHGKAGADHARRQALPKLHRGNVTIASAVLSPVGHVDQAGFLVEDRDRQVLGPKNLADLVADGVDDCVVLELLR